MQYILLGVGGFLLAYFFDPVSLRRVPYAKPVVWLLAVFLLSYAHIMVSVQGDKISLPTWLSYPAWPLLILAGLAMIYSLFVEIPLKQTYMDQGVGDRLVTTGTYALTRHPGVLWYALLLVALILVSRSWLALLAAPIWLLMDILHVWIQDRFFFNQMFPGYKRYQQETPMLIPNRRSLTRFLRSLSVDWRH